MLCLFPEGDFEISYEAFNFFDFGVGSSHQLGAGRARVNHFWCEYSYTTVHGGEGLVKLGHDPTDCRFLFLREWFEYPVQPGQGKR